MIELRISKANRKDLRNPNKEGSTTIRKGDIEAGLRKRAHAHARRSKTSFKVRVTKINRTRGTVEVQRI